MSICKAKTARRQIAKQKLEDRNRRCERRLQIAKQKAENAHILGQKIRSFFVCLRLKKRIKDLEKLRKEAETDKYISNYIDTFKTIL